MEVQKNEVKQCKIKTRTSLPIPTILLSVLTMQAPTCVLGSFDLMAERKATDMK